MLESLFLHRSVKTGKFYPVQSCFVALLSIAKRRNQQHGVWTLLVGKSAFCFSLDWEWERKILASILASSGWHLSNQPSRQTIPFEPHFLLLPPLSICHSAQISNRLDQLGFHLLLKADYLFRSIAVFCGEPDAFLRGQLSWRASSVWLLLCRI